MKAKKYRVKVCASALDYAHGGGSEIEEICVPELGLVVNYLCVFTLPKKDLKRRVPKEFEEVELEEGTCRILLGAARLHKKLKKRMGWV